MGPVGLIILAIVAAVILAIVIFKNWDKIVDTFKKTWTIVWDKIQAVFKGVVDKIKSVFDSKFGWLLPGGALLKALFLLRDNWDTIWSGMKAVVRAIANPIIGTINTVIGAVNTLFDMLRKIEIGWEEKKIGIGKFAVTLPAFNFVPFKALPTIPTIPTIAEEVTKSPTRRAMTFAGHDFPALAAGGIVKTPTLALLGERGPEAVVPLGRGGMGGITINILGPTYGFDDFEERVSEAISDGVRRGGYSGILAPA
jgi:hypothetical protein